jgi:hypothetical protein
MALFGLVCLTLLNGCGGGGSSGNNQPPPTTRSPVSGTVTDVNGSAIVGATVTLGNKTATTTQFGTYTIPDVAPNVYTITASATINNRPWTGQNTVEVISGETNTSNVHIVLSDTAQQGSITGNVSDTQGRPLANVKVFAAAPDPQGGAFFTTLGAIYTLTDPLGNYTLPSLPFRQYVVAASFAGYLNQTATVTVANAAGAHANFTLTRSNGPSTVPVVPQLFATAFTVPSTPTTRAAGSSQARALNAIRQLILKRLGRLQYRMPDPTRITLRHATTRSTPAGSIIENDLFWDFDSQLNNVWGYDILRSINTDTQFVSIALLRDPLGDRYADIDSVLTPDLRYYYSIARLDTINFPANGTEGDPVNPPVVVRPLQPIAQTAPNDGATVAGAPVFTWTAVPRAFQYHVLVYDRFPDLNSDTDPNGVKPIWPADVNNPGSAAVLAPATSLTYAGPALQSGHTYYWAVFADDVSEANPNESALSAFSISQIRSFVAQ